MNTAQRKPKGITPQQTKALHAQFRAMGFDDDERHSFIADYTNGRTCSTTKLTQQEAHRLLAQLSEGKADRAKKEARTIIKQIFRISFDIPFLNQGFANDTPEDFEMNKAKINAFCRDRSKFRKPLTMMTLAELKEIKRQLEAIARKSNTNQY